MTILALIILIAIVTAFIIETVADLLNLKQDYSRLPSELSDLYDSDKKLKSKAYHRERTYFGIITSSVSLAVLLIFWFLCGFNWLDLLLRDFIAEPLWRGVVYIALLSAAQMILSLPASLYSVFVIEEKYGFNKTNLRTFFLDKLKGLALAVAIGVPILILILWIFDVAGSSAWLWGWAAVTVFSIIMQYIAPRFIMPLFNKFKPLEDGSLKTKIFKFAEKVNFPLQSLFVMDGSKRSSKSNAFFTGFGSNKRIVLYDTLLDKHPEDEILAIIAHEAGHYKLNHIKIGMLTGIIHTGILFYLLSLFTSQQVFFDAFYVEKLSFYLGLVLFGIVYSPVEMLISPIFSYISRKHEYEADAFAAKNTGQKQPLINSLKKLSETNLSNLAPHKFYVFMNYSHPPLADRINNIKSI